MTRPLDPVGYDIGVPGITRLPCILPATRPPALRRVDQPGDGGANLTDQAYRGGRVLVEEIVLNSLEIGDRRSQRSVRAPRLRRPDLGPRRGGRSPRARASR